MRILEVGDDGRLSIGLHPRVAVVHGLDDDQRAALVRAIQAAATGHADAVGGLIEVHGVRLDLDEPSLALLDLAGSDVVTTVTVDDLREASAFVVDGAGPGASDGAPVDAVEATDATDPVEAVDAEQVRTALELHRLVDPAPVADALHRFREHEGVVDLVPSPEAVALAERLEEVARRLDELGPAEPVPTEDEIDAARARLDEASDAFRAADDDVGDESLRADIDALERAHAAVDAAREAHGSRFGRSRAAAQLAEALDREEEVLARLGLTTYADFLMRGGSVAPPGRDRPSLGELSAAVDGARDELDGLQRAAAQAAARDQLLGERVALRAEACRILGEDADAEEGGVVEGSSDHEVVGALRARRVPADDRPHIDALVAALSVVGLDLAPLDLGSEEIDRVAEDWLAAHAGTEESLLATLRELTAAEPVAGLRARVETLAATGERPTPEEVEWYLLTRIAAQRNLSYAGAAPLVIDGALDHLDDDEGLAHLLERLERMADSVQIIHVSDDPRIVDWADSLPGERAGACAPVPRAGA